VTRVGSTKPRQVDVRVIAATHRELTQHIRDRLFREDLYYRLAVVRISIPPLRERREDIPVLCQAFLRQAARDLKVTRHELNAEALARLKQYSFPGNIRELRNLLERACILSTSTTIGAENFPISSDKSSNDPGGVSRSWIDLIPHTLDLPQFLSDAEKQLIERALSETEGTQAEAARRLGVSRSHLSYKISKFGLRPISEE